MNDLHFFGPERRPFFVGLTQRGKPNDWAWQSTSQKSLALFQI